LHGSRRELGFDPTMNRTDKLEDIAARLAQLAQMAKQSDAEMLSYMIELAERECALEIKKRLESKKVGN